MHAHALTQKPAAPLPSADPNAIIDGLGGPTKVAQMLAIRQPSVSLWRTRGIPLARQLYLHQVRPDVVAAPVVPTPAAAPRKEV